MRISWPIKILLYSIVIAGVGVSLTAMITVRTASHLWEEEFFQRNKAFSSYTSHDVLRIFGGNFSGVLNRESELKINRLLSSNEDLIGIMILTERGRVLFSSVADELHKELAAGWPRGLEAAAADVIGDSRVLSQDLRAGGVRYLDIMSPVSSEGGIRPIAVKYLYGYGSLDQKISSLISRVMLGAIILTLLVVGFSALLSRGLVKPVRVLSASAKRIADGEREHRIELKTGDELEDLALQFNMTVDSLKQHQDELERANRELLEANMQLKDLQSQLIRTERLAALGQLSAGVSHELDNPIGVILGYSELLLEDIPEGHQAVEYAVVLRDEAKRCKRIIAGLLDFARPSHGEKRVVDLELLLRETIEHLREQRPFKNVIWHLDMKSSETMVQLDPDAIRQVVVNLALNSSQAMDGQGDITVAVESEKYNHHDGLMITFQDSGPGINEEDKEKVFDPFYTTKRRGEGTGLGLSICRKLVVEAGGWIRVVSGVRGNFEVWLPVSGGVPSERIGVSG